VVAEKQGVQVAHVEQVKEKTEIILEKSKNILDLVQVRLYDMVRKGILTQVICDKKGRPVPQKVK
jgi:hypothetical protein